MTIGELFSLTTWQSWLVMLFTVLSFAFIVWKSITDKSRKTTLFYSIGFALFGIIFFSIITWTTDTTWHSDAKVWLLMIPEIFISGMMFFIPLFVVFAIINVSIYWQDKNGKFIIWNMIINLIVMLASLISLAVFKLVDSSWASNFESFGFTITSTTLWIYFGIIAGLVAISFAVIYVTYVKEYHYESVKSFFTSFHRLNETCLNFMMKLAPAAGVLIITNLVIDNGAIVLLHMVVENAISLLFLVLITTPFIFFDLFGTKSRSHDFTNDQKNVVERTNSALFGSKAKLISSLIFIAMFEVLTYFGTEGINNFWNVSLAMIIVYGMSMLLTFDFIKLNNETKIFVILLFTSIFVGIPIEYMLSYYFVSYPLTYAIVYADFSINYIQFGGGEQ